MPQSTLRTLARAYANGQIEKDKYRTDRAAFLLSVVSGEASLPSSEPSEAERIAQGDTFNEVTRKKIDNERSAGSGDKTADGGLLKQKSALIFGCIGVVVLLVIIVMVFTGGDSESTAPQLSNENEPGPLPEVEAPPSGAQNLIARFLNDNNWSQSNLDTFLMNWRQISESQRASAANSTEYSRLINAIYKKLLEERALSRIGNPQTAYEKQRILVDFADTIGIRDQRITLPEEPPSANQQ